MPPKKKSAPKKGDATDVISNDQFLFNYKLACKAIGATPSDDISAQVHALEGETLKKVCTDSLLEPAGVAALCAAIMGRGKGMKMGPFYFIKAIRLWHCSGGDSGANSLAELLVDGIKISENMQITYLEYMDSRIGPIGCSALGEALTFGSPSVLTHLSLDHNSTMKDEGLIALSKGLRTNTSLKYLSLTYCDLTKASSKALQEIIIFGHSSLAELRLDGNYIQSEGFIDVLDGLQLNKKLLTLSITDNGIGSDAPDIHGKMIESLCNMFRRNKTLGTLDMDMNRIGSVEEAELIKAALDENTTLKIFRHDDSLPNPIFTAICRTGKKAGGKKKGGKKKGGKKKKKK
eukprot:TRINITY_DN5236_c0_g1_i1.p1 TRINITY_DN5236_c0_g1~~TRINITY_DN5236_c0_g1_i1.p1  ORF type:complete len:347 (+),score=118.51 TRINITY_DN5236_c0_g1_i1:134-1174(+)